MAEAAKEFRIGIVGNPNCGKTTLFNALTGSKQHVGNWAGVPVEKSEGVCTAPSGRHLLVTDTPGVYSLTATSEDDQATLGYLLSREADVLVNVVDATSIERNLYLTLLLCELKLPLVVAVTMTDIARRRRIEVDYGHLEAHLGVPVVPVDASDPASVRRFAAALEKAASATPVPTVTVPYPDEAEREIDMLSSACVKAAEALGVERRWLAMRALEGDPFAHAELVRHHDLAPEVLDGAVARCSSVLKDPPDVVLADARYGVIAGLVKDVVKTTDARADFSERVDRFVLNRFLGIPLFFLAMYLVFWFTQTVGGAFVDFFEIAGGTLFVGGLAHVLGLVHAPDWVVVVLSNGVGTALQTLGTFLPPVGFMFFCLAVLEDSGYMARAAFVMDRFMRWIGLPGKSFVPMLVGFGCTVPAILATRALESKRDRFLTVFMAPFMSCGAKLPIWTLFAAAFCSANPGNFVALMYGTGVILGIGTGLLMKRTLFRGEPTHFIMELPPYHLPRLRHILRHTWERSSIFVWRAGAFILPMMLVMGTLNSIGTDGSVGRVDPDKTFLSAVGKAVTPIFEPIGVEKDNWPASVAVFTGLFAKESVIGTMKGIYGQMDAQAAGRTVTAEEIAPVFDFVGGLAAACRSVPDNLADVGRRLVDPFGIGYAGGRFESDGEAAERSAAARSLASHFPKGFFQAFSYLLFILLYMPCVAATGTVFREVGKFYGTLFVTYLTLLGWSTATLFYAITVSHSVVWACVGASIPVAMFVSFRLIGRKKKINLL